MLHWKCLKIRKDSDSKALAQTIYGHNGAQKPQKYDDLSPSCSGKDHEKPKSTHQAKEKAVRTSAKHPKSLCQRTYFLARTTAQLPTLMLHTSSKRRKHANRYRINRLVWGKPKNNPEVNIQYWPWKKRQGGYSAANHFIESHKQLEPAHPFDCLVHQTFSLGLPPKKKIYPFLPQLKKGWLLRSWQRNMKTLKGGCNRIQWKNMAIAPNIGHFCATRTRQFCLFHPSWTTNPSLHQICRNSHWMVSFQTSTSISPPFLSITPPPMGLCSKGGKRDPGLPCDHVEAAWALERRRHWAMLSLQAAPDTATLWCLSRGLFWVVVSFDDFFQRSPCFIVWW